MANSTTCRLSTGSTPGIPRQTGQTCELGSPPKAVEQPQKILLRVRSWAWTSIPITSWKAALIRRPPARARARVSRSSARAARSNVDSSKGRPTSCSPTGSPFPGCNPAGTESPGSAARLQEMV